MQTPLQSSLNSSTLSYLYQKESSQTPFELETKKEDEESLQDVDIEEFLVTSPKPTKTAQSKEEKEVIEVPEELESGTKEELEQESSPEGKEGARQGNTVKSTEKENELLLPLPSPHYSLGQAIHQMKPPSESTASSNSLEDPFHYYNAYYNPPQMSISLMGASFEQSESQQGSQENLLPPSALYPSFNPSLLGKRSYSGQNILQQSQPKRTNLNFPRTPLGDPAKGLFEATYSNIEVYEFVVNDVAIMRRKSDSWINGTHVLKAAGIEKGKRTKILEKEVHHEEHEKVQGGYGRYQGTWFDFYTLPFKLNSYPIWSRIPVERARLLARDFGVAELLAPILDIP